MVAFCSLCLAKHYWTFEFQGLWIYSHHFIVSKITFLYHVIDSNFFLIIISNQLLVLDASCCHFFFLGWLYYLFKVSSIFILCNASFSVGFPILVNRGWVPRSWKDKFLEASQDEQFADPLPSPSQADGTTSSWWRFWSKSSVSSEVVSASSHFPHNPIQKIVDSNLFCATYRIRSHL